MTRQKATSGSGAKRALTPPTGIRDLLPPESGARQQVSGAIEAAFERYGYQLVRTPLFENAEVFERSPGGDPRDLVRFVEPDTGDVAALRPDITPQIARLVATRMKDAPPPWRIRYEGKVVRRRRGRARKQRQVAQVGVELIGVAGPEADAEVIALAAEACGAAGLNDFQIELSPVGVARALLDAAGIGLENGASEAMARKDERELEGALKAAGVGARERRRILSLAQLYGDTRVLSRARKLLGDTAARRGLARLEAVVKRLEAVGLAERVGIDFGELRGASYYTGLSFSLLAAGPGEAVASGGRYDQLLGLYGPPQPATGVSIDLENLLWALGPDAKGERGPGRIAVTGSSAAAQSAADALRGAGLVAAVLPKQDLKEARAYARAWDFDAAGLAKGSSMEVAKAATSATRQVRLKDSDQLQALDLWLQQEG